MSIKELNKEYDKLQNKYGAKELNSIYNGGCESNPEILFIFMNPTGRNIASSKEWKGIRSPWIGTKNIWKLFYKLNLLDKDIFYNIQEKKANEWNEEFADLVYNNVKKHKYFITNLGKCTQLDARHLPDSVYKEYLDLLYKEIEIIRPKKIVSFGNQVSLIFLGENINVSKCRKQNYKKCVENIEYNVYATYYPIGNGMRNIDKTIEDLKFILGNDC
jgi:DNA polymerase